jgi:hypothetical protein
MYGIFTRSCGKKHQIEISYSWIYQALNGAGLIGRERPPLPGMRSRAS